MDVAKYRNLPDSMTPDETRELLKELMAVSPPENAEDDVALAWAMDEVADRQWHTYTLLDATLRKEMDNWVINNWDHGSLQKVQVLISVIAKLGLVNSCEMLKHEVNLSIPSEVRFEIERAIKEFGATVDDPYSGMKVLPKQKSEKNALGRKLLGYDGFR